MLGLAILFLVIALAAAFFGFRGAASVATGAAKVFFFVFLVLFVITLFF